jgi:phosphatidyl-myo-inositol dimannoside synthase
MKKILLPTLDYVPQTGGVARYIHAINETLPEVHVSYWKGHSAHPLVTFFRLLKEGVGYKAIWVHHLFPLGMAAYLVNKVTRKPYTVFLHGMDFDLARRTEIRAWIAKHILKSAKNVVTNTNALKGEVDAFAGVEALVVHPVVDDGLVEASKVKIAAHRRHEDVVLLTVARLVSRKGHEAVLRMLSGLQGIRYHIVGDGAERAYLAELVEELGLEDRVEMQQSVSDKKLADLYRQTDIFIMPTKKTVTDREGFGIVYLEAQLFGVPVIATNHPGVDEALVDGVSGLLVKDDAMQLKHAVKKLAKDPDLRKRMGRAGREFVLAGFTRAAEMKKLRAIL